VVLINNQLQRPNFHSVCSDHQEGGHMATKHLLERGHKRIGFLEISPKNWGARAREAGYRQAIAQSERAVDEDLIVYTRSQPLRDVLSVLLARGITGLVICGEDLSMAANQVLIHELKVRMPDDLSVVSFELPPVSALLTPPQTTIEQPWDDIGSVAVETVLQRAYRGDGRNVNILLHNHLIERNSVRTMG
jgi:LacI family transcriptional regulator